MLKSRDLRAHYNTAILVTGLNSTYPDESAATFISRHVYPPPLDVVVEESARIISGRYFLTHGEIIFRMLDTNFREFLFHALG